ncbi:DUF488 domain-containing protein [Cellulosimicrobium cellulans]|uniref:DUF488 domain-containing protein n=1 Tax=Cellulosimicrobium cellulans TaxID=1710 RepID=UPI00196396A6|nr:DUF488 domain-containing protein [Cellulosimicrobium cellulans]MBN0040620.1 DUF488 domain-containing protein [Cellulosimicrobium cellulans]
MTRTSVVYTVGHSTRPVEDFLALLRENGVRRLVDVRTVPKSRHNPQYHRDALAPVLRAHGITYRWVRELGGLRRARPDSPNAAWRNLSFRGYADHMQTPEFAAAVDDLVRRSTHDDLVIMCAEAVPWRCHRSLVGDALVVRGVEVRDIVSAARPRRHTLTSFARVEGTRVWYPPTTDDPAHDADGAPAPPPSPGTARSSR